jgi:hypothetical protein
MPLMLTDATAKVKEREREKKRERERERKEGRPLFDLEARAVAFSLAL